MFIAIGKIIQIHGINGYVKAISYSGILERFSDLKTLYIEIDDETKGLILEDVILRDDNALIKFRSIHSREEAAPLVQRDLLVPYENRIELPKGIFFIHDLVGMKVFDIDGNYLGVLENISQMGNNDIYQVNKGKDEILIPAISQFIKEISLEEKRIVVQLVDGMISPEE